MGLLGYLIIGLIVSVILDRLLVSDGEEPLSVFQGVITLTFWPVVVIFYIISYLYTLIYESD